MADLQVQYNGISITPTPLVSYSEAFIDYGLRWGNVTQIQLNGVWTGIPTNFLSGLSGFASTFASQFGTLTVSDITGATLYSWGNINIDEIGFGSNKFYESTIAPYSIKMRSYNVPSGVIEPVNEYTFTQGDDGIVTITHKIGAKGIKNANGALSNAIAFVQAFTGLNPFAPAFMPSGSGIQVSINETIDRGAGTYNVIETFKYNTGSALQPYIETFSVNINDAADSQYLTFDTAWKLQGSSTKANLTTVEANLPTAPSIISRLAGLGYITGFLAQTNMTVTRDTGAAVIEIKNNYISGYSSNEINGFFDYIVSVESDLLQPRSTWKIEGEFFCKGPFAYRTQQLNAFKASNGSNWRQYLSGLIVASPIFTNYHTGGNMLTSNSVVDITENTGEALLKLAMTMGEQGDRLGAHQKYTVDIEPARWNFELMPAANIEGHYVVQDPQMQSRSKVQISVSTDSLTPVSLVSAVSGVATELSNIYVVSGVIMAENLNTGITDITYNRELICTDSQSASILYTKVVGSTSNNFVRQPGYRFGY